MIQAEPIEALMQMGAYLSTLKDFSVTDDIAIDETDIDRKLSYDGKTFTIERAANRPSW